MWRNKKPVQIKLSATRCHAHYQMAAIVHVHRRRPLAAEHSAPEIMCYALQKC